MKPMRTILAAAAVLGMSSGAALAVAVDGKALFEAKCTTCHAAGRSLSASKDKADWQSTVERMKGKGAKVSADEAGAIAEYLAKAAGK